MKKILMFLSLSLMFCSVSAQTSINATDTIVVGSIEKSCPGGFEAFNEYIKKYVAPPAIAFEDHKVGTSYVSFIIEPDGTVSNVFTILAAGSGMDEQVTKVIEKSNNWLPATINNIAVRSFCRVGVQFFGDFDNNKMWVEAKKNRVINSNQLFYFFRPLKMWVFEYELPRAPGNETRNIEAKAFYFILRSPATPGTSQRTLLLWLAHLLDNISPTLKAGNLTQGGNS